MVVKQLRFDLGWAVKENVTEKVDLDINVVAFDADGEVLAKINYANKEAPGLVLGHDHFRPALKKKTLSFEVFEEAHISLPELPEGTDSLVIACTNYTDTGFDVMEKVRCRVVDVTKAGYGSIWSMHRSMNWSMHWSNRLFIHPLAPQL